ncbi:MAG: pantoate--beta-alanine ligase [Candidatus Krumholzibacteria bacterium]
METIRTNQPLRGTIRRSKAQGKSVVLVPTMGALHDGHRACIELGRKHGDVLVVSIFVNPTQFGPGEDFESYRVTLEDDFSLCRQLGCDIVFAPQVHDMYPEEHVLWVQPGDLAEPLCGATREGHFRGVCTVVRKLFDVVEPNVAVFGQKDAQQALVIREMVTQLGLNIDVVLCPVIREDDGLACSSRNRDLAPGERERAAGIYQGLLAGKQILAAGERDPREVCSAVRERLERDGAVEVEYIELLDTTELRPLVRARGKVILAVAGRVGRTRLIDNLVLRVDLDGGVVEDSLF